MRKFLLLVITIAISSTNSLAQEYLWPVAGAKPGANILYAPQSYIESEHNLAALFVAVPEGTPILCPTDATITHYGALYNQSLNYHYSFGGEPNQTLNEIVNHAREHFGKEYDPKFISGDISISVGNGIKIHITGLLSDRVFKSGQKLKRGDTLGVSGYCYIKINEPSIEIAMSKYGKVSDPMTPFGIKSTFIAPAAIVKIDSLTKEQAISDIDTLFAAVEELVPSLHKIVSAEEYKDLHQEIVKYIREKESTQISTESFRHVVRDRFNPVVHDSHIYLYPYAWQKETYNNPSTQPRAFIGWQRDTLRLYLTEEKYKEHIGKEIVEVNGISADSALTQALTFPTDYDADVESMIECDLAFTAFSRLFTTKSGWDMTLKFADGTEVFLPEVKGRIKEAENFFNFRLVNKHEGMFDTKMLNDSVAYLGISTFALSEIAVEDIGRFVDSIEKQKIKNIIVDVRGNPGGWIEPLDRIFSFFATDTIEVESFSRVNKVAGFKYLDLTTNYIGTDTLFDGFEPHETIEGFVSKNYTANVLRPDSVINYTGRLYILTDQSSCSAATLFPAMAIRSHRGVTVGRETNSAYHYITALKFGELRLPNSTLTLRLPLVEEWFDTVVNKRVPFGRGVIPDYEIPITHSEMLWENGDTILNYALRLIAEGKYLKGENPFYKEPKTQDHNDWMVWGSIIGIGAVVVGVLVGRKKKGKCNCNK